MEESLSILAFSDQIYRKFLRVYPPKFREEFNEDMAQLFRDLSREVYQKEGLGGLIKLYLETLFDLLKTAFEERFKEATHMTKEKFIQLSGWGLMLGGFTFVLGFGASGGETSFGDPLGGPDAFYEYSQLVLIPSAFLFFTVGMLGLRLRYGQKVGSFGSVSLALGTTGGFIGLVGALGLYAASVDAGWIAMMFGLLLMLIGLALFGIAALRNKPLPRGNGLPLLPGSMILLLPIMSFITGKDDLSGPILGTIFFLIAAGFIALGYVVQGDAGEEMGAA